jgi:hypothetical protein
MRAATSILVTAVHVADQHVEGEVMPVVGPPVQQHGIGSAS